MDTFIAAGSLRQRVSILQPSSAADSIGDTGAATVFATRWAAVSTLSGQEFYRSQQFTSEANRLVVMRYLDGVTATMSLQLGSRLLSILYVEDVEERHVKLVIYAKEVQ